MVYIQNSIKIVHFKEIFFNLSYISIKILLENRPTTIEISFDPFKCSFTIELISFNVIDNNYL